MIAAPTDVDREQVLDRFDERKLGLALGRRASLERRIAGSDRPPAYPLSVP
jgi:hypothetical protein